MITVKLCCVDVFYFLRVSKTYETVSGLVEVNVSLLEDLLFLLEVVSEPGNVVFLLSDGQIRVSGQTGHHELHEVTHRSLTGETLLQVFL